MLGHFFETSNVVAHEREHDFSYGKFISFSLTDLEEIKMSISILVDSGTFIMGASKEEMGHPLDKENPRVQVSVDSFWIDDTTVTNEEFKKFVDATNYETDAERLKGSFVFHLLLNEEEKEKAISTGSTPWWCYVETANWRHPEGEGSSVDDRMSHPVVHVSRNDAIEYCNWAGKRLPTEAEWEFAARAGSITRFPWGDELTDNGVHRSNVWQGKFPFENTGEDGYIGTAPVKTYSPNQLGLFQMVGNVWEWCLNPSRITINEFNSKTSLDFYNQYWMESKDNFAAKGGSFLCHSSYCNRYRLGARNQFAADTSSSNLGFRCVSL